MIDDDKLQYIEKIIDELIDSYRESPINHLNINDFEAEQRYLISHKQEYIRTIKDIVNYYVDSYFNHIKILEIGCFLGIISVALSRIGFRVTATDIKEYISCRNLQTLFQKNRVDYIESNLRDYQIPFSTEEFDAVIMCEVLEHLNFNPLPVIKEINRIMKTGGLFYVTLPNIARSVNVLNIGLYGKAIHDPIKDFFTQLNPKEGNKIVGLHWREYTAEEIKEMLEQMDFKLTCQVYEESGKLDNRTKFKLSVKKIFRNIINIKPLKRIIFSILFDPYLDPTRKSAQINFAVKKGLCKKNSISQMQRLQDMGAASKSDANAMSFALESTCEGG
ncbi:MAG: class I SAM-dependent methyltransferase [Candidatus Woesebacteria bacterium]|nr:class I SAM-dependent methyltransferase [Candidatus Woesebacteria bacterium]